MRRLSALLGKELRQHGVAGIALLACLGAAYLPARGLRRLSVTYAAQLCKDEGMDGNWGMAQEMRLEQFSRVYVRAVAAVAGATVYEPEVDDDSIDLGLATRGSRGTRRSPRLELQVKGTGRDLLRNDGVRSR